MGRVQEAEIGCAGVEPRDREQGDGDVDDGEPRRGQEVSDPQPAECAADPVMVPRSGMKRARRPQKS
jgi:hypothetical protein